LVRGPQIRKHVSKQTLHALTRLAVGAQPDNWPWRGSKLAQGKFASGNLIGWDMGEWGGELTWEPRNGPAQRLYSTNVRAIAATKDGAIAVLSEGGPQAGDFIGNGPGDVGFALHLMRDETGKWRLQEAAQFPGGVNRVTTVAPGVYAAASGGRAIVFSSERILGAASCVGGP